MQVQGQGQVQQQASRYVQTGVLRQSLELVRERTRWQLCRL
jgi:hypothetical protein